MKKAFIVFCFFCLPVFTFCQKLLPAFGKIDVSDLRLQSCSFEPEAPAMKLFETDEVEFQLYSNGDAQLKIEHRTRIKVFTEAGYKYVTIRIPYLSKKGLSKIKELNAIVYSLDANGNVITQKLAKSDIFKENVIGNVSLISFSFPNLKPGSVIEYSYTKIEANVYNIDPWFIQDEIPTVFSSYIIITPPTSTLRNKLYGSDSVKTLPLRKKNAGLRYASWYKENIHSLRVEPFMSSKADNQMKMVFFHFPVSNSMINLLTNPLVIWNAVGNYMLESSSFGGQLKKTIRGTERIIDSAKQLGSVTEKIKYVYSAVNKRFRGKKEQAYEIEDLGDAWKDQSANTGEINCILLNLLSKAKITSYPLMVSTRDNGLVDKNFPSFGQLDNIVAVAMIDSSRYYILDASIDNQPLSCPPLNILNREALLMRQDNIDWFLIEDKRPLFKQSANIICDIDPEGIAKGEASLQHYYYAKKYILDTAESFKNNLKEKGLNKRTQGLTIISSEKVQTESEDDPLYETISFTYEPQQTNEFFFYDPSFLLPAPENLFITDKRITDIDFGCNREIVTSLQFILPPLFEPDYLPKSIALISSDSSFIYKRIVTSSKEAITVSTNFQITKSLFSKEKYQEIKDFYQRMQTLAKEEIVLKKKK